MPRWPIEDVKLSGLDLDLANVRIATEGLRRAIRLSVRGHPVGGLRRRDPRFPFLLGTPPRTERMDELGVAFTALSDVADMLDQARRDKGGP